MCNEEVTNYFARHVTLANIVALWWPEIWITTVPYFHQFEFAIAKYPYLMDWVPKKLMFFESGMVMAVHLQIEQYISVQYDAILCIECLNKTDTWQKFDCVQLW